mgnify:CR=1 FL=1
MSYVLIVEDEEEIRELLVEQMKMLGHRVISAHDGADAYLKAANQKFDLICTDYMMPKLNGAQLIAKLRDNKFNSKTPIIVYTAFLEPAMDACEHFPNIHFVPKPSLGGELEETIWQLTQSGE